MRRTWIPILVVTAAMLAAAAREPASPSQPAAEGSALTAAILPPQGFRFVPGQRFDLRVEGSGVIAGAPVSIGVTLDGRDVAPEIFGRSAAIFPILDKAGRPTGAYGAGTTANAIQIDQAGPHVFEAVVRQQGREARARSEIVIVAPDPGGAKARNLILFIGDGMGLAYRTAARIARRADDPNALLEMDRLDHIALVSVRSLRGLFADSAATASAMACGDLAPTGAFAVMPDGDGPSAGVTTSVPSGASADVKALYLNNPRLETIFEMARRTTRRAIGLVTSVEVMDATPAAFIAHTYSRHLENAIAEQITAAMPDVLLGGGLAAFVPKRSPMLRGYPGGRSDGRDLMEAFHSRGYALAADRETLETSAAAAATRRLVGLFAPSTHPPSLDRELARRGDARAAEVMGAFGDVPDLAEMTRSALQVLNRGADGFVLMVEGGRIDHEGHMMDGVRAMYETLDLDRAVGVARKWASARGKDDTLVIVTSDHETGGLGLPGLVLKSRLSQDPNAPRVARDLLTTGFEGGWPGYHDSDGDGYPDDPQPDVSLAFGFASRVDLYEDFLLDPLPRLLSEFNPTHPAAKKGSGVDPGDERDGIFVPNPAVGGQTLPPGIPASRFLMTGDLRASDPAEIMAEHTASDVIASASGPGSEKIRGTLSQPDLFFAMAEALGLGGR
jgi:alkaline phosphatase